MDRTHTYMHKLLIFISALCLTAATALADSFGSMYQWRSHAAFSSVDKVVLMGDQAYGLSCNSLFSVHQDDQEIHYYSKLDGLSGSTIDHIAYNPTLQRMIITYRDGLIDIMHPDQSVSTISDLFLKQMSTSKQVNDICMYGHQAILAMDFGLLVVDMRKAELTETYYIGPNSSEVSVSHVTTLGDSIYAATDHAIYTATLGDNLMDYAYWHTIAYPAGQVNGLQGYRQTLHLLLDQQLYFWQANTWQPTSTANAPRFRYLRATDDALYAMPHNRYGAWLVHTDNRSVALALTYGYNADIQTDGHTCWLASLNNGLIQLRRTKAPEYQTDIQEYYPEGPSSNFAYRLRFFGDRLYMLPGGRWASEFKRAGDIMIYQDHIWTNISNSLLSSQAGGLAIRDLMNVAQDPLDDSHYFVTTYGTGLLEMRDTTLVQHYLPHNSPLSPAATDNPNAYTRTDGAMYDDQGYLWVLSAGGGEGSVHVISPQGQWSSFNLYANGSRIQLTTPGEILVDGRNPQWKWIPQLRADAGLILLQDNGTPTSSRDDHVTFRKSWIDQNGSTITPGDIRCVAQDHEHTLWVGTSSGIFAIPYSVDFTSSNRCVRVVIPRNDGSQLGDYLLDNEQVNAIAVDGANRLWVGTANSGLFLLQPVGDITNINYYTVETVSHFTAENSMLPSNEVISLAIQESTGELFIGTGAGLVSYMSDATMPHESFDQLYAYPNPVRPSYEGYITITGMMSDTEVRILDAAGHLVKLLTATGGSAVWDGTNAHGHRVASGVYTALCNTPSGHGTTKILIMN